VITNKHLSLLISVLLISSLLLTGMSVVRADEDDYSYEMYLPADGSEDAGEWFEVVREDDTEDGYILVEAYQDDREVHVTLENIDEVELNFDENDDMDLEQYLPLIRAFGAEITIIIDSDTGSLSGTFTGVPEPDEVSVETDWDGYTWEEDVFEFDNLQTSTTEITLNYAEGFVDIIWTLAMFIFTMGFVVMIFKFIIGVFDPLLDKKN